MRPLRLRAAHLNREGPGRAISIRPRLPVRKDMLLTKARRHTHLALFRSLSLPLASRAPSPAHRRFIPPTPRVYVPESRA